MIAIRPHVAIYKLLVFIMYNCCSLNVSGDVFSWFGINKISQISRTFLRILAECNITIFCNSVTLVFIPISSNLFFSFFGVVPKVYQSIQLHSTPFQALILLLKLERVFDCLMSLGSATNAIPLKTTTAILQ